MLTDEIVQGSSWRREAYDFFSLPLFMRANTLLPMGENTDTPEYDYLHDLTLHVYALEEGRLARVTMYDMHAEHSLQVEAARENKKLHITLEGHHANLCIALYRSGEYVNTQGAKLTQAEHMQVLIVESDSRKITCW